MAATGTTAGVLDLGSGFERGVAVRWQAQPGVWVNVSTRGMSPAEAIPIAASLQVVDETGWEAFRRRWT